MENVTVSESARLRARCAESGTAHPQSSTQPGSDPAATATPSTAQSGAALADGLPGTTDTTPSQVAARGWLLQRADEREGEDELGCVCVRNQLFIDRYMWPEGPWQRLAAALAGSSGVLPDHILSQIEMINPSRAPLSPAPKSHLT